MASYFLYGVFQRNPNNTSICHWKIIGGVKPTFKITDLTFLITEEESFDLINKFSTKPVAYQVCWIVRRGRRIVDKELAVRFFHPTPAMIWKLSRV